MILDFRIVSVHHVVDLVSARLVIATWTDISHVVIDTKHANVLQLFGLRAQKRLLIEQIQIDLSRSFVCS